MGLLPFTKSDADGTYENEPRVFGEFEQGERNRFPERIF
jgi:hypothetical protein